MTIAIGALRIIARNRGEEFLVRVLKVLVGAKRGPIKAGEVAAAAVVLAEHPGADDKLRGVVASHSAEEWAADAAAVSARTGENGPSALAGLWAKALGVAVARKSFGKGGQAAQLVRRLPAPEAQEAPKPAPPPPPPPPAPKLAPAPATAPAQAVSRETPPARQIARNGIVFDLDAKRLTHRGKSVLLTREDWRSLTAALLRVMPAILGGDRLSSQSGIPTAMMARAIIEVNPVLRAARLEVVTVGRIGYVLKDLG